MGFAQRNARPAMNAAIKLFIALPTVSAAARSFAVIQAGVVFGVSVRKVLTIFSRICVFWIAAVAARFMDPKAMTV
jgi:hypothetical protein